MSMLSALTAARAVPQAPSYLDKIRAAAARTAGSSPTAPTTPIPGTMAGAQVGMPWGGIPRNGGDSFQNNQSPVIPQSTQQAPAMNSGQQGQSPTDLINSIYQSQLAAQQQQNKQNRDNLLAGISGQDALANQNATNQLNQNDVSGARTANQLREHMASQGLGQGGDYISQQVGQNTAQGQNANLINQNLTNSLNGNLAQRNAINNNANASDLAIMQNLQGQQSQNLLGDLYKSRDFGLQQANVTGQYGGQNTMQQNQNNFNNGINQGHLTGYYGGPQGQNGYGQNQQGYGQNQNTGMNGNGQNNNSNQQYGVNNQQGGQIPNYQLGSRQYSYAQNQNAGLNGGNSGNGFQSGMGGSQGIRTLAGQQLDQQGQEQLFNRGITAAGLTGMYDGKQTLQGKASDLNNTQVMAALTGKMPDGTPTSAQQQLQLQNAWKASDESGVISPVLAQLYGIPAGTPTQAAKQFAQSLNIQQQNANTSAASVSNQFTLGNRNADIAQGNQDMQRANLFGNVDPASGQQSIDYVNKVQDNLYKVWNESGKAPAGIDGVEKGTLLNSATMQQRQLANAYKTWNETGVAPDGIPGVAPGTPKFSINANNKANLSGKLGTYASDLDKLNLPPTQLKAALQGERAKIISETSVADYERLYNTYFNMFGQPK